MNSLTRSLPARLRSPASQAASSDVSSNYRFRMLNSMDTNNTRSILAHKFEIPIVGYEVIEERARFTVFKLRIENSAQGEYWFIFRRYTDFVRLLSKIKSAFPKCKLSLPRKRWFGDNFDPRFLDDRTNGLQMFVDSILQSQQLCAAKFIRDFFCLDEPPSYAESVEESRAIFEALEETISRLRAQIQDKDVLIDKLRMNLSLETKKKDELLKVVTSCDHVVTAGGDAPSKSRPQVLQDGDAPSKSRPQVFQDGDAPSKSRPQVLQDGDAPSKSRPQVLQDGDAPSKSRSQVLQDGDAPSKSRSQVLQDGDAPSKSRPQVLQDGDAPSKSRPQVLQVEDIASIVSQLE